MILAAVCLSEIGSGEGVWFLVVMLKSRESLAEDICLFMVFVYRGGSSLLKIQTLLCSVFTSLIFWMFIIGTWDGPKEQVG